jgi:hypothetical protein
MVKNFYYSLSVDVKEGSISIGVDDASFKMTFPNALNKEPEIEPTEKGYILKYNNIFRGVDIYYDIEEAKIKETIFLKNKSCPPSITLGIKTDGCSVIFDKSDKKYKIVNDKDRNELFAFDVPHIVSRAHNSSLSKPGCVRLSLDGELLNYIFNKEMFKNFYPIEIDPTFTFNTSVVPNRSMIKGDFSSANEMFLTGSVFDGTTGEYIKECAGNFFSDDVIFGNGLRIIFPYLYSYINKVDVKITNGSSKKSYLGQALITSISPAYGYVDIPIVFSGSNLMKVQSEISLKPNSVYSVLENVSYQRSIVHINDIKLFFQSGSNIIYKKNNLEQAGDYTVSNNKIYVGTYYKFKPLEFHVLPFDLIPTNSIIKNMGETITFKKKPVSIDSGGSNSFGVNLDVDFSILPITVGGNGTNPTLKYSYSYGISNSFPNEVNVVLKSAVNYRTNVEEGFYFKQRYGFIDESDYSFSIPSNYGVVKSNNIYINQNPFLITPKQKSTIFFKFNSENDTLGDYPTGIIIKETSEIDIFQPHTSIEFPDSMFIQKFSSTYPVIMDDGTGTSQQWTYANFIDQDFRSDIFSNFHLIGFIDGKFYPFEILGNTGRRIILKGKKAKLLKGINKFFIIPQFFNKAKFIYEEGDSRESIFDLVIESISDNGIIIYKDISINAPSGNDFVLSAIYYNNKDDFGGIKVSVQINSRTNFEFLPVSQDISIDGMAIVDFFNIDDFDYGQIGKYSSIPFMIEGGDSGNFIIREVLRGDILLFTLGFANVPDTITISFGLTDGQVLNYTGTLPNPPTSFIVESGVVKYLALDSTSRNWGIIVNPGEIDFQTISFSYSVSGLKGKRRKLKELIDKGYSLKKSPLNLNWTFGGRQ